jgi:Pyridine nucleotide-disulphide oxidoreductase
MAFVIDGASIAAAMSKRRVHVQIAGAGVAALEAALALQALAADEVSVELVAPEAEFTYRPLAVAEPFGVGEVKRFPLSGLVDAAGAHLRAGSVAGVDAEQKLVTLADGQELGYDVLLLALGARPREAVAGALTFRGPQDSAALSTLLDKTTAGEVRRIAFTVPLGASWPLPLYELAILTAEYMVAHGTRGVGIVLVTPEDQPLALFGPAASGAVSELLATREISVETSAARRVRKFGRGGFAGKSRTGDQRHFCRTLAERGQWRAIRAVYEQSTVMFQCAPARRRRRGPRPSSVPGFCRPDARPFEGERAAALVCGSFRNVKRSRKVHRFPQSKSAPL